ncbi:sulfotransferase [Pseudomonadota bacterium]
MQENIRQKALRFFQQGHANKAQNLYEKLCKKKPNDAEALYMLGSIYGQRGEYKRASQYFKKTLQLQPNAFVAVCGLAASHKELGEYSDAQKAFQQALELQPGNTDILLELAGIDLQQNKIDNAESILREILTNNSRSAEALHGMGEVLHSRHQLDLAEDYYKQALAIQPERADTHNRLGHIKHTKGLLEQAIFHYKKAIAIQPDEPEFWKKLSQTQLLNGDIDKATESINRALKRTPDDINAIAIKASIYERSGDAENAYKIIQPLLKKNILHTSIARIYVSICKRLGNYDEAIKYLDTILEKQEIPDSLLTPVHYEAGKLFDKLGKYDRAFKHYETANKSHSTNFQQTEHSARIEEIIQVFDWSFLSIKPGPLSFDKERPVFIVGMPRSGTSLIEQILDSHIDITGAGELTDIENISVEISNTINSDKGFPQCFREVTSEILDRYAEKYLDKLSSISTETRYVTDKMPQNFIHLGLISLMFPKAKIIHCVRNPIDTCLSIYFQQFNESHKYATHLEDIAHYYKEYRRLMNHWKMVLPLTIHDVNYDELVNSPEAHIRDLLNFLELNWDDNCLMFHKSSRHVATASYEQVTSPLYTSSQGRWENYKKHVSPLLEPLSAFIKDSET